MVGSRWKIDDEDLLKLYRRQRFMRFMQWDGDCEIDRYEWYSPQESD